MNKKLVSIVMSAATLLSGVAFADFDPQFYVGAEVQAGHKKGEKNVPAKLGKTPVTLYGKSKNGSAQSPLHHSATGGSLFVGSRVNENFGVEIGASALRTEKSKNISLNNNVLPGSEISIKNSNIYADAMGYLPVDCALDLIGSVGVGQLSTKISGKAVSSTTNANEKFSGKSSKAGVRAGLGAQYKITDNLSTRLMVRYQKGNRMVNNTMSTALGMFYQF